MSSVLITGLKMPKDTSLAIVIGVNGDVFIPDAYYWDCELLKGAKAIEMPAVPVVMCKDCKFYTDEERWCRRLGLCGAFDPNGYCSHGERSEE